VTFSCFLPPMPVPMPLLRLQALSGSLYAPCLGRQVSPPAGVSALWQTNDHMGAPHRG